MTCLSLEPARGATLPGRPHPCVTMTRVTRGIAPGLLVLVAACAATNGYVVFTRYSPLSRNAEIARRVLPPVTHRRIARATSAKTEG